MWPRSHAACSCKYTLRLILDNGLTEQNLQSRLKYVSHTYVDDLSFDTVVLRQVLGVLTQGKASS
jgi:hypothetical protein